MHKPPNLFSEHLPCEPDASSAANIQLSVRATRATRVTRVTRVWVKRAEPNVYFKQKHTKKICSKDFILFRKIDLRFIHIHI